MRALAPVYRFKKQLSVAAILVFTLAVLHSRGTLQSSLGFSRNQSPIAHDGTKVPGSRFGDAPFDMTESIRIRKELGKNLAALFDEYRPPISDINPGWWDKWPTMPPLEVKKKYNYSEVVAASQHFFLDDKSEASFKKQQVALMKAIPAWSSVNRAYSGRGVVISAGAAHLTRVWPHVVLMLRDLNSTLPIEVWTKDQEEYDITLPLVQQMRDELKIPISVHTISDYMSVVWNVFNMPEIFKVKALALLFSSFDETVLFDADSMPVMDPAVLFDSEQGKSGLIQWPDFWSNSVSKIMHDVYHMPNTMIRTCESGQLMLSKRKQFEPLVLATYHNWWGPDFFYKLIYMDSMGAGDKDTFWVGSAAYQRGYHVVERPLELIAAKKVDGKYWKEAQSIFNGAMGQFNPLNNSEIFTMHMHAPKVDMQNPELAGQFDLLFFHPDASQNVSFKHGEQWLESRLWEHLRWIECESLVKKPETSACEGIKLRLASIYFAK